MKLLQCLFCEGELDIIGEEGYLKKVKCKDCGFTSSNKYSERPSKKEPEILIKRKIIKD